MESEQTITIGDCVYRKNPEVDRYQICLDDLADLKMEDIPPHSHLEILGIPGTEQLTEYEVYGLNGGDKGDSEYLEVYGGVTIIAKEEEKERAVSRLKRAFPIEMEYSLFPNPHVSMEQADDGIRVHYFLNRKFKNSPDTLVRDAVSPFVEGFARLAHPDIHAFICHASEDKTKARELAQLMKHLGTDVWFDEWEIKVGQSIVQKINEALGVATHLILLISIHSINKPWVQKEFSAALMRQLDNNSITVLPLLLDDSSPPPIISDIKYADGRGSMAEALKELKSAMFYDKP